MKYMLILIFSFILITGLGHAYPQMDADTLRLSLNDAVFTALERNPNLLLERYAPSIAQTYAKEQRALFDPVLSFTASQDESKTQRFLGSRPDPFDLISKRTAYSLGLSEILPTGTVLSVDATMNGSTSSIYTAQYSGNIGVTLTQSLLRGLGPRTNLASLRKARLDVSITYAELRGLAQSLVAETERAYWALYLSMEELKIQERSLELARRQMEESLERVAVGRLAELELASVRAEVARRESARIDARSQYEQARLNLIFLLNPQMADNQDPIPFPIDRPEINRAELFEIADHEIRALASRPDLAQARYALQKGKIDVVRTRNGLLPRLDFFVTLGRTTYAQSFNDAVPEIESPFYNVNAGLTFDFSVPNRQARAQAERATQTQAQLDLALENMRRLVKKELRSAYIEVTRTRQQIEAARVTLDLQQKTLEAEVEKFRVGRSTNLLVLQVQRDFTASQLDDIRAVVNHLNALVDFYLKEGTLLEKKQIAVPETL